MAVIISLLLLAACLPWEEKESASVTEREKDDVLLLFEDFTEVSFIPYLIDNGESKLVGSSLAVTAELEEYGKSRCSGSVSATFRGTLQGTSLKAEEYEISGELNVGNTNIILSDASGYTDGLVFHMEKDITSSYPARIRYPESGEIRIAGKDGTLMMLFPENPPFTLPFELSDEKVKELKEIAAAAFSLFSYIPEVAETRTFNSGTATFTSLDNGWKMEIRADDGNTSITMSISSGDNEIDIIYGNEYLSLVKDGFIDGIAVPDISESDMDRIKVTECLDAFRSSNIVYALMHLINGRESGVITLEKLTVGNSSASVILNLDNYGLAQGIETRTTGKLNMTLYGEESEGKLTAKRYSISSASLRFISQSLNLTISLRNVTGYLEGDSDGFTLTQEENGYSAECGNLILSLPEAGEAEYEDGIISF